MNRERIEPMDPLDKELLIMDTLKDLGYTSLRQGQEEPIKALMDGKDTFIILPTGGGKSLIFALVARAMKWKTIVFSPLVSLMQDQVDSLLKKGVKAAAITSAESTMNTTYLRAWQDGDIEMLYVAPERLDNKEFLNAIECMPPQFIILDEAHTLSKWMNNFRPKYALCGKFIEKVNPIAVAALTATATQEVVDDVKTTLNMRDMQLFKHFPSRTNLKLSSSSCGDEELFSAILNKCRQIDGSVIIYCASVKTVEAIHSYLTYNGENATLYHAQITDQARRTANMRSFMNDEARICVATNAFGMGIDKANIRAVIHAQCPSSVEAISQEIGRAARDGKEAICHLYDTPSGRMVQDALFSRSNPTGDALRRVFNYLNNRVDSNNELFITLAQMTDELDEPSTSGAISMLESTGVIERFQDTNKVFTFYIFSDPEEIKLASRRAIMDAIHTYGTEMESTFLQHHLTNERRPVRVFKIALDTIAEIVCKKPSSVRRQFDELKKAGHLLFDAPFKGSGTRILRALTDDDINTANNRYMLEKKKLNEARAFLNVPDEDKHQYLQNYFELGK